MSYNRVGEFSREILEPNGYKILECIMINTIQVPHFVQNEEEFVLLFLLSLETCVHSFPVFGQQVVTV